MLKIRLLGVPCIISPEGTQNPVRGHQAWAVLARVLLSDRPVSRRQIAAELFPETVDPLGALRWCLAALRRALGPQTLTGDPLLANLPNGSWVDALALDEIALDPLTLGDLLDGTEPEACGPDFSTWLLVERVRIATRIDERLHHDAQAALVSGETEQALALARYGVQRQPFDEGPHVLLIRALVQSGKPEAARKHAEQVDAEFRRELGEPASSALRSAARAGLADPPPGPGPAAVAETLLEAGTAALAVGAVDAGLDCLRRAAAGAQTLRDDALLARCLAELGTALIHTVRGQDDEGTLHLRSAEKLALHTQNRPVACRAVLELSYAEALAGRRPDAQRLVARAFELSDGDPSRLATAHGFAGFNLADWGRFDEAFAAYDTALAAARACDAPRREAWILALGAWGKLRAGHLDQAEVWSRQAMTLCDGLGWLSFRPWAETVLAEVHLATGTKPDLVRSRLDPTLALSCEIGDPCWEAAACRVIGLSHEVEGASAQALTWLGRGTRALRRVTDPYAALLTRITYDQTRIAVAVDPKAGSGMIRNLLTLAARSHAEVELNAAIAMYAKGEAKPKQPSRTPASRS